MLFKSDRIRAEWADPLLNPKLKDIVSELAEYALARHDWEFLLTCIYRTPLENDILYGGNGDHLDGVHVGWRGVDVRTFGVDPQAVGDVTTFANDRWQYDPTRPMMKVALLEGTGSLGGSSGPHLHFQSHLRTSLTAPPDSAQDAPT